MRTTVKLLAATLATFGLMSLAQAQPATSGNTSGSGAKSPDTTRPDGAKGSGTMGSTDPKPSAAPSKADKKEARDAKAKARADTMDKGTMGSTGTTGTTGTMGTMGGSAGVNNPGAPPAGGPSGGAKP